MYIVENFSGAAANLQFRVTGNDGFTTTGVVEPNKSAIFRPGAAGLSTVEIKSAGAEITGYGYPASWVNP